MPMRKGYGAFGRVDFREDKKKKKKKKREKMRREYFLECVWLERGEGKKMQGFGCFLPRPTIKFSSQNR